MVVVIGARETCLGKSLEALKCQRRNGTLSKTFKTLRRILAYRRDLLQINLCKTLVITGLAISELIIKIIINENIKKNEKYKPKEMWAQFLTRWGKKERNHLVVIRGIKGIKNSPNH